MAYVDYILCESCDCKLIYDAGCVVRDGIEARFGERKIEFLCPDCRDEQPDVDELIQTFEHILEYWNKDTNEQAMIDALLHIEDVARKALAKMESKQ